VLGGSSQCLVLCSPGLVPDASVGGCVAASLRVVAFGTDGMTKENIEALMASSSWTPRCDEGVAWFSGQCAPFLGCPLGWTRSFGRCIRDPPKWGCKGISRCPAGSLCLSIASDCYIVPVGRSPDHRLDGAPLPSPCANEVCPPFTECFWHWAAPTVCSRRCAPGARAIAGDMLGVCEPLPLSLWSCEASGGCPVGARCSHAPGGECVVVCPVFTAWDNARHECVPTPPPSDPHHHLFSLGGLATSGHPGGTAVPEVDPRTAALEELPRDCPSAFDPTSVVLVVKEAGPDGPRPPPLPARCVSVCLPGYARGAAGHGRCVRDPAQACSWLPRGCPAGATCVSLGFSRCLIECDPGLIGHARRAIGHAPFLECVLAPAEACEPGHVFHQGQCRPECPSSSSILIDNVCVKKVGFAARALTRCPAHATCKMRRAEVEIVCDKGYTLVPGADGPRCAALGACPALPGEPSNLLLVSFDGLCLRQCQHVPKDLLVTEAECKFATMCSERGESISSDLLSCVAPVAVADDDAIVAPSLCSPDSVFLSPIARCVSGPCSGAPCRHAQCTTGAVRGGGCRIQCRPGFAERPLHQWACQPVDPCEGLCPEGATCFSGAVDGADLASVLQCRVRCKSGLTPEVSDNRLSCIPESHAHPCSNQRCPESFECAGRPPKNCLGWCPSGTIQREGKCLASESTACEGVVCPEHGICKPDPNGRSCNLSCDDEAESHGMGWKMDPATLQCVRPCEDVACLPGAVCTPQAGKCVASCPSGTTLARDKSRCMVDPCFHIDCPDYAHCTPDPEEGICRVSCVRGFQFNAKEECVHMGHAHPGPPIKTTPGEDRTVWSDPPLPLEQWGVAKTDITTSLQKAEFRVWNSSTGSRRKW
jgi:hypothetical protein